MAASLGSSRRALDTWTTQVRLPGLDADTASAIVDPMVAACTGSLSESVTGFVDVNCDLRVVSDVLVAVIITND